MARAENKIKGNIGEAAILFEFIKYEIPVCIPYGDNERYDLIAEFNGMFNRIQIKYCDCDSGTLNGIICPCASSVNHTATRTSWENYQGEVDYFAYYFPRYNVCCLVPMSEIGGQKTFTMNFNEEKPLNEKIHWYKDYLFENYFSSSIKISSPVVKEKKIQISEKKKNFCIDCNTEINIRSVRCNSCQAKTRIIPLENMPITREELKNMIRTLPFTQIGEKFQVSDNTVRKWCDKFNLPRKKTEINSYSNEEWEKI